MSVRRDQDSLGRGFDGRKRSNAALVSALFRVLKSATQSETVATISRAAFRGGAAFFFRFFILRAGASSFFTILIFGLSFMIVLYLSYVATRLNSANFTKF